MRALVTGGSGFIGSHVVDRLIEHGVGVRIFDMVLPTFRSDVEFYHGSLLDLEALQMAMNSVDVVFHLAAVADVKDVYEHPHYSESINVRGTINVLEAVRNLRPRRIRVIYGSTTWVYGDTADDVVNEESSLGSPAHLYTATKVASEYYCRCYSKLYDVPVTILRYGIPYGPRGRDGAVIPIFVRKALRGEPITLAGDGSQFRQFIYVEDLAAGNVLALKPIAENKTYNLDGSERITIRQIAETVQRLVGDVTIEYTAARPGDFSGKQVSSALARRELGWEPKVQFEDGVHRYLRWYQEREVANEAAFAKLHSSLKGDTQSS